MFSKKKELNPSTQKASIGYLSREEVIALSLACMNQQADVFAEKLREKGGWPELPPLNRATRT